MVVQAAVPLAVIASQMGLSIPAVIEYFQGQNIDLSGYGSNDLVDLETLFPQTELERIKKYKTYDESFYDAPPVVGDTSLDNIIVQSKKDDEPIEVSEDELEVMPSQEVTRGDEPDNKPPDWDPEPYWKPSWRDIAGHLMEKILDKQVKELEKNIEADSGLNFPKEKTDNNTRLHNLRLQNIIDGKAENYPGGPQNDRIVINAPEGSNLPPIAIGNITYKDWEDKITLDETQIMEAANWYEKIFSSLEVMAGDDKNLRDTLVKAWLSGQINETPSSALNNVIYVYEQWKRGVPFDEVKGKGLPDPTNNIKSIIYGKEIEKGIGPKISDFIDAGLNSNTRSWMGHNSSGGQPFVVDIHTARDMGLVDQTYLNHLEKLGYIIPEDIKIDFGQGGITGTKYENRALFGQGLTKYLNDKKWMGKSDWKPSEIQAIGWMNLTNMYAEGNQSGDILKALNRNLRRISMELDPGEGSPWQITYGEKYNKLDDDKKFTIVKK